mgnify:CR=1 FL=1
MNTVTFVGFDFVFGLNATKIVICSQIVPDYPEIISISLNLISFVAIYRTLKYNDIAVILSLS